MNNNEKRIMKLCSFYVSDWHLVTMLLPYINKQIDEETNIATILEQDIQNNVETLVKKLNLKNEEKILNINWNNKNTIKYSTISRLIDSNIENSKKNNTVLLIVNGNKDFIEKVNKNIDKYVEMNEQTLKETRSKIKVIDFYEIVEFNGSIVQILDNHDKILNTSGEKEINEVFEDYVKRENNEEKIVNNQKVEENTNEKIG